MNYHGKFLAQILYGKSTMTSRKLYMNILFVNLRWLPENLIGIICYNWTIWKLINKCNRFLWSEVQNNVSKRKVLDILVVSHKGPSPF